MTNPARFWQRHLVLLVGVALCINVVFYWAYGNLNILSGLLVDHGEVAYNVATNNSVMLNSARVRFIGDKQSREERRIDYAQVDHTQFGAPDRYRSVYDTIGYGVLIGLMWKVTNSFKYRDVQFLQMLLHALMVAFIFHIALMLFGMTSVAYTSCALFLSFFPLTFLNVVALRDVWAFYAVIVLLYGVLSFVVRNASYCSLFMWGLLAGLCQFIRPSAFFSLAALSFLVLFAGFVGTINVRRAARGFLLLVIANGVAFWLPFTMYNKKAYDRYLVGPSGIGALQGLGQYDNPWGYTTTDTWYHQFMWQEYGLRAGTQECEDVAHRLFVQRIKERPWLYLSMVARRASGVIFSTFNWWLRFADTFVLEYPSPWKRFLRRLRSYGGMIDLLIHHLFSFLFLLLGYAGVLFALYKKQYFSFWFVFVGSIVPGYHLVLTNIENRNILLCSSLYLFFIAYLLVAAWDTYGYQLMKKKRRAR